MSVRCRRIISISHFQWQEIRDEYRTRGQVVPLQEVDQCCNLSSKTGRHHSAPSINLPLSEGKAISPCHIPIVESHLFTLEK